MTNLSLEISFPTAQGRPLDSEKFRNRKDKIQFTKDYIEHPALDMKNPDEQILSAAVYYSRKRLPTLLLTNDRALRLKSIPFSINTSDISELDVKLTMINENKVVRSVDNYFTTVVNIAKDILGIGFSPKENLSGITFWGSKGRIIKVVKTMKSATVEFNVPVVKVPGLIILSDKEARGKSMGTCRWIYKGTDLDIIEKLIRESLNNYY